MKDPVWKQIFLAIPLPAVVVEPQPDDRYIILDVNEAYLELTGSSIDRLVGKSCREAFPRNPDDQNDAPGELLRSFQRVLKTGREDSLNKFRYDIKYGEEQEFSEKYWNVKNIPLPRDSGEPSLLLHCAQDVSHQVFREEKEKRIQEMLDFNKQQFKNFIQENPDGLYRMDVGGDFLHVNQAMADILGLPFEKVSGKNLLDFCAPDHRERVQNQLCKASHGISSTFEGEFINNQGQNKPLKINLMPMTLKSQVVEVHGIAKDLTEVRHTEKVMVEKSRFLEVNAAFITSLVENELNAEVIKDAFGIIASTVEVDRMYYFGTHRDSENQELLISQKIEWTSQHATPQIHNPDMQNIRAESLREIMAPLRKNLPFSATLSELPPCLLKDIFVDQGIKSMLLLPIILDNQLYGFIGIDDCRQERIWTEDEVIFLQSLAHNFTASLEKRNARRAIKKQEEQLLLSEKKFKALVQEGSDLVAILDLEGRYTFISDSSARILGVLPEEFIGRKAFEQVHHEDLEEITSLFEKLKGQKQVTTPPFRLRDREGNWKWMESTATNLLDDPAVQGIVVNSTDITTLMNQAREIKSINERYMLAARATEDLIYDWDLQKNEVMRFHRSVKELFGYTSEEVNEKTFWNARVHPDDFTRERGKLDQALADPTKQFIRTKYRFRRADGTYAEVIDKGYILRNAEGKPIRLIGATTDVSEMKAKEEALKAANKRFKMAMKATNEMIWDWDIASDSVTRSKGYKNIFGYDTTEATSVHSFWITKVAKQDRQKVKESLAQALANPKKKKWMLEYRIIKADGTIAYVHDRGYILRDEQNKAVRVIGAVLDVTESRRLIRKTQKQNRVLKQIAWEQSHIVRAPLARIKGLLNIMEEGNCEEMSTEKILFHIKESVNELDDIVRNIVEKTEKMQTEKV